MKKYRVSVPFVVWVSLEVEADDQEAAEEKGYIEASIQSYMGNGSSDRLIGVTEGSIFASDEPLDSLEISSELINEEK